MPELVPNYITTNPDGSIVGLFPGGVLLPAGSGGGEVIRGQSVPGAAVVWEDAGSGALLAQVGYNENTSFSGSIPDGILSLENWRGGIGNNADKRLAALYLDTYPNLAGNGRGAVLAVCQNKTGAGFTKEIIDSNGASDFLQLRAGAKISRLSWGFIHPTGTILVSSGDFTLVKAGTGAYNVTFGTPIASGNYGVLVSAFNSSSGVAVANVNGSNANGFGVVSFASTTGVNVDSFWTFAVLAAE